jgi:vancomycin resistance protein YoaR
MTADEIDLVDEIYGLEQGEPAETPAEPESDRLESVSPAEASEAISPKRGLHLLNPLENPAARGGAKRRRGLGIVRLAVAFVIGALGILVVATVAAFIALSSYATRVVPGVRVGSVDVSGLDRGQLVAKLQNEYAYLGQGEVTVTTPTGAATITYQQAGRSPDVAFMADAAMGIGHTGYPIVDAVTMLRSALNGQTIPIAVKVDPNAVATQVRQLVGTDQVPPKDAGVTVLSGTFALGSSTTGRDIDERAVSSAIVDRLTLPDAPAQIKLDGAFVPIDPQISDQDAQSAAAAAQRMIAAVNLTWGGASFAAKPIASAIASATASPSPTPTLTPTKMYTIDAPTIRSWIVFGTLADGSYGPSVNPTLVQAYLSTLAPKLSIKPVEPSVVYDASGKPSGVRGGKDGASIDVAATTQAIETHLESLAAGGNPGPSVGIVSAPVSPQLTAGTLSGLVVIGQGAWTTVFYPDISNGFGANIRTPAALLNGQVVGPGQQFSFLKAVGPIDPAHGYTLGGVIEQGKSNHTGAMGGGICSASTTMFNAAARAGLKIDERHAHFYYISRYPVGLDATVFYPDISNGFGANIRTPAALLNGQVVGPGQQFSFLKAVGPIDPAHGYTLGGVIEQGKSNHTGAMGGGICSASTTMFNAAARAGLKIDERHAHFYYISRYPVGLDATVFSNGSQVWDLKWTNDTPNPIVIRSWATRGSTSKITIQLWSLPLDRKVTFSPEFKANIVKASDRKVYVSTLKPGQQNRPEYPTNGFDTSRTRTVTDSAGNVIHRDTWNSHYTKVDGLLQIGITQPPKPTPPPPAPTPTPGALAPAPVSNAAPNFRRRTAR